MRYGGYYPDMKLRLFRRVTSSGVAHFTDRPVHESVQVDGRVETMTKDFLHHGYPNLELYLEHMNRYSSLGAKIVAEKGKISRSWPAFFWNAVFVPKLTFFWNYVFRLGFLDGREGLLLHLYHSAYISWKYAKAWQIAGLQAVEYRKSGMGGLREPFDDADDSHGGRAGVSGDVGAGVDLVAVFGVVLVGEDHHLFVGDGGGPAELVRMRVVSKTKLSAIMR